MTGAKIGPPLNPYIVLALAILLPGAGHVAVNQPQRGLGFAFFSLLLTILFGSFIASDRPFFARVAIGLTVWALSIPDAYRIARIRYELWKKRNPSWPHR